MKNKIIQLLQSTAGMLIFALLSGCAYYIVVLKFKMTTYVLGGASPGIFLFLVDCILRRCCQNIYNK